VNSVWNADCWLEPGGEVSFMSHLLFIWVAAPLLSPSPLRGAVAEVSSGPSQYRLVAAVSIQKKKMRAAIGRSRTRKRDGGLLGARALEADAVANERASRITDAGIAAQIRAAWRADVSVSSYPVSVVVRDGRVLLFGRVDWRAQRDRAVELAAAIDGVSSIISRFTIASELTPRSDAEIRAATQEMLLLGAEVAESPMKVEVHSGIVTLRGRVADGFDRQVAEASAYQAGATLVLDHLKVSSRR
jgi:osmotically-inducible protein OsmY